MDSRKRNIVIGIAIAAIALFFLARKQKSNAVQVAPPPAKHAAEPITPQVLSGKPTDYTPHQMEIIAQRKAYRRMQAAGFTNLPAQGGSAQLSYKVNALERHCSTGDLDIIEQDLKLRKLNEDQLVFTVESLAGDGQFSPLFEPVSLSRLRNNTTGLFSINLSQKPQILGLFLCSFSGKPSALNGQKRVCADLKDRFTIPQLVPLQKAYLTHPERNRKKYPHENKIFFFQMLIARPQGLFIYRNKQTFDYNLKLMRDALELDHNDKLEADFKRGIELMQQVTSVAPLVTSSQVTLFLPHKGNCPGGGL